MGALEQDAGRRSQIAPDFIKTLAGLLLIAGTLAAPGNAAANIVGYYNKAIQPGLNLFSIQLRQSSSNVNHIIGAPPDGTTLHRFNPTSQTYFHAGTFVQALGWVDTSGDPNSPALDLPLGEGFWLESPEASTMTIVGEVVTGSVTNPIPAWYSLKGSMLPFSGGVQTVLSFPPRPDDTVFKWVGPSAQSYYYDGWEWLDDTGNTLQEPSFQIGDGFAVWRAPAEATQANWWVINFNLGPMQTGVTSTEPAASTQIDTAVRLTPKGELVLTINATGGALYDIQHSSDQQNWVTVARGLSGPEWRTKVPTGVQGFYRAVTSTAQEVK